MSWNHFSEFIVIFWHYIFLIFQNKKGGLSLDNLRLGSGAALHRLRLFCRTLLDQLRAQGEIRHVLGYRAGPSMATCLDRPISTISCKLFRS